MNGSWFDASEAAGGMLLAGRIPPALFRVEIFPSPYNDVISDYLKGTTDVTELIVKHGIGAIQPLLDAEERINGSGDKINWIKLVEQTHAKFVAGKDLEKLAQKLQKGDDCDLSQLREIADKAQSGDGRHLKPLTEVDYHEDIFIPSGWKAFDDHTTGLPKSGLIICAATPGTGKTWWGMTMAIQFLRHYKDKKVAFFSAEMPEWEVKERTSYFIRQDPSLNTRKYPPESVMERFTVDDGSDLDGFKIVNRAAEVENLGLVVCDFADLFVNEISEPEYTRLYMTLAKGAKTLGVPVLLLAQLSGNYTGGLPRPNTIRYTRLAEALAWMIVMLWNPSSDSFAASDNGEDNLPILDGQAYSIIWKIRGGFQAHKDDCPGAIAIPFRGEGFHPTKSAWYSLKKEARKQRRKGG